MKFREEIRGKHVLVFGLGLQGGGLGDANWLHQNGAEVRVTDLRNEQQLATSLTNLEHDINTTLGSHSKSDINWADIVIKNPGVPDNNEYILYAKELGKKVYTSIAIFVREARDIAIGITGTRGKSTTTELIYTILDSQYPGLIIRGGNIPGTSGLALLDGLGNAKYAVLELSSFQLHNFHDLHVSPHIAVVTNIYPDHLNRYVSMEDYIYDKASIAKYQEEGDFIIANAGSHGAQDIAKLSAGQLISFSASDLPQDYVFPLPGLHNRENLAAAWEVSKILDLDQDLVKMVAKDFHGLPFRLQKIKELNGVTFINDTTSTTPVAATKAIESLSAPTSIILGGQSKNLPYDTLLGAIKASPYIENIVILGSKKIPDFVSDLKSQFGEKILGQVDSMQQAVTLAYEASREGWNVLLSPGFTSFDLYDNEFARGRDFNKVVGELK